MKAAALVPAERSAGLSLQLAADLRSLRFAFATGREVAAWLEVDDDRWTDFAGHWDRLTLDRHMGDGGRYRLRRYGAFEVTRPGPLRALPHAPYLQPKEVNRLNGGIERHFDPLEPSFAGHVVLERLLVALADVLDAAERRRARWNIRVHPYRILATADEAGQPTPEGLHRDGVDHIVTLLVQRRNVDGGRTMMTDAERRPRWHGVLAEPMDLLVADDRETMHAVTPVTPSEPGAEALRDVLVIAFTKVVA